MKTVLTLLFFSFVVTPAWADHLATLIESADTAKIIFYTDRKTEEVVLSDRAWLHQFARTVDGAAGWWKHQPCLCISFPEVRFFRDGKQILSLSIPHDSKLRCYSQKSYRSGDFSIKEQRARQILSMLMSQKPANQSPEPTPTTVTPPAGQEARQP